MNQAVSPLKTTTGRMHSLDALRGLAALAVVIWHWQHFFFVNGQPPVGFRIEEQPLYLIFMPLYHYGAHAVDLFFSLSGFVFFWLYATRISEREVSASKFFLFRFSRLYPLHLLTFFAVVLGQWVYLEEMDYTFVYLNFDLWHAFLNVLMASSLGLENGSSFNAPVWSVSVEVVLYLVFFLMCFFRTVSPWVLGLMSLFGFYFLEPIYSPLSRGFGSFFLGGVTCWVFTFLQVRIGSGYRLWVIPTSAVLMWIFVILIGYDAVPLSWIELFHFERGRGVYFLILVLFPMTILSLALLETRIHGFSSRLAFLGDISYSSYLWHFPLQLLFVIVSSMLGLDVKIFTTPTSMLVFFLILLGLSRLSYLFFEMPLQRRLRAMFVMPSP